MSSADLLQSLEANGIALIALLISVVNIGFYVKDYRWKSRPRLRIRLAKNRFTFDVTAEKDTTGYSGYETTYDKGASFALQVRNTGGVPTQITAVSIGRVQLGWVPIVKRLTWHRSKLVDVGRAIQGWRGSYRSSFRDAMLATGDVLDGSEPQDSLVILGGLLKEGGLKAQLGGQNSFVFVIEHTFGSDRSNFFEIELKENALTYFRSELTLK